MCVKMASDLRGVLRCIVNIKDNIFRTFYLRDPFEGLTPAFSNLPEFGQTKSISGSLLQFLQTPILWAVPKHRRSIEKRRCRRFGWPNGFYKMIRPKSNILTCLKCGSYFEAGLLCPTCYAKVKKETEEIQEAIQAELGISPVESDVVVLYNNEKLSDPSFYQGKRIIEMKKDRPKVFSNNLLQRTTKESDDTKEITSKDLPFAH